MWCIQNFASLSLNNFPLAVQVTNLSNAPCQVISFSLNHVPSGTAYWQFSISFLPVASARSCSPVTATFSSPHISSLTNTAGLLPSLSTLPHFHSFLLLTQVQPRGLAELCLGLFLHFLLYLVHGPIYSCIFFSTASQVHAFFMSLCALGFSCRKACFSPNPLESSCIHLIVSLSCCPRKSFFFQVRKLFKVQLLYCQKSRSFSTSTLKESSAVERERYFFRCRATFSTILWGSHAGHLKTDRLHIR